MQDKNGRYYYIAKKALLIYWATLANNLSESLSKLEIDYSTLVQKKSMRCDHLLTFFLLEGRIFLFLHIMTLINEN